MTVRRVLVTALFVATPAFLHAQTPATPPTPASATTAATAAAQPREAYHPKVGNEMELGRQFTAWLYAGRFDSLFAHMDAESRTELGTPEKMAEEFDEFVAQVGDETKVIEEKVVMRNGNPQYWRTADFSMAPEPIMIRWVIVNGEIWGIGLNPASRAPAIDPIQ